MENEQYRQQEHKTISLPHPELGDVSVDATIAPMIQAMWRRGWTTFNSCENNFGYVWVEMDHLSAEEFLTLIAKHADDAVLSHNAANSTHRDVRVPPDDPEEWVIHAFPRDTSETLVGDEIICIGFPDIEITISIRFPMHRLNEVMAIVQSDARNRSSPLWRGGCC